VARGLTLWAKIDRRFIPWALPCGAHFFRCFWITFSAELRIGRIAGFDASKFGRLATLNADTQISSS